ncbi:MAG: hypothetical protein KDA41_14210, partial [Planctomycetales bacterium]|nr:hypothetical protein [Planctomycetales bacterium]
GGDAEELPQLSVTLAGEAPLAVSWNLQQVDAPADAQLQITGDAGVATLTLSPSGAWQLKLRGPDGAVMHEASGLPQPSPTGPLEPLLSSWKSVCHTADLAEASLRSLKRGRTIQVFFDEPSEQQTFKSVMAAGGCLLLLAAPAVLALFTVIDALGLSPLSSSMFRLWPLYLLAPVVLFLLLQVLWRVFPKGESRRE